MLSGSEDLERLREALGSLVGGDVSELLTQAREDARGHVRALLAELMAEEMLEQARRELRAPRSRRGVRPPRGRPAPAARGGPEATAVAGDEGRPDSDSEPGLGYYVYGVSGAGGAAAVPETPGVDGDHPVTGLPAGELVALVSRVPLAEFDEERLREHLGDIAWVETIARRHEEVLEFAAARTSVVPMRLCSIYREAAGVRAMLERESAAMQDALALLEGRSEWGVKVFSVPAAPSSSPERPGPEAESGAAYLEQRRQDHRRREAIDEERAAACGSIHDRLSGLAVRARVIPPQRPEVSGHPGEMVLNAVYLIDDGAVGEFHDALAGLQSEFGVRGVELQSTGPWPAYNFVPDAIGVSA